VTVPPGYSLTMTAVLCSNQVVLKSAFPNASMTLLAPSGLPVQGNVNWSLLGDTTFADGAPMHLSLGLLTGPDHTQKSLHLTPPEPVSIEWVGEPNRIWPPQNGHSRFLLVKGTASNPAIQDQPQTEWALGIETRIDPLPPTVLRGLKNPTVLVGTNSLADFDPTSSSARATNTPTAVEADPIPAVAPQGNER